MKNAEALRWQKHRERLKKFMSRTWESTDHAKLDAACDTALGWTKATLVGLAVRRRRAGFELPDLPGDEEVDPMLEHITFLHLARSVDKPSEFRSWMRLWHNFRERKQKTDELRREREQQQSSEEVAKSLREEFGLKSSA